MILVKLYYGNFSSFENHIGETLLWEFESEMKIKKIKINLKKVDVEKYPLVEVKWKDIVSDPDWKSFADLKKEKLSTCITKGHLLSQSNGITRIFGDYAESDTQKGKIEEVGNTTLIPNGCIINIKKL